MKEVKGPDSEKIRSMFSTIAHRYDHANTVLSGGVHHLWRKKLVRLSGAKPGDAVLDCATGTGDLAIEFAKVTGPKGRVVGSDFCKEMLEPAPAKAVKNNVEIKFEVADVTRLPYANSEFDFASIAFGIRNVENTVKGIDELARVTKPGGQVIILEFGSPQLPVFRQTYDFYSKKILPVIGGWVTGDRSAYQYLQTSSAEFPCRHQFVELMKSTGRFSDVKFATLTGGIAYIYQGTVGPIQ